MSPNYTLGVTGGPEHRVPSPPSSAWCPGGQTPSWVQPKHPSARRGVRGAVRTSRRAGTGAGGGGLRRWRFRDRGPGPQRPPSSPGRRAGEGGRAACPPRAGPPCARSPPPPRRRPQLPPDTHALSTSSRTFHMFSIAPRAARPAAARRHSPRTPGRLRAGAGPGPGRRRHPPPRTLSSRSSFSRPPPRRRQ